MQIPESIEAYGYFWLEAEPDGKLSGILRISEKGMRPWRSSGLLILPIANLISDALGRNYVFWE